MPRAFHICQEWIHDAVDLQGQWGSEFRPCSMDDSTKGILLAQFDGNIPGKPKESKQISALQSFKRSHRRSLLIKSLNLNGSRSTYNPAQSHFEICISCTVTIRDTLQAPLEELRNLSPSEAWDPNSFKFFDMFFVFSRVLLNQIIKDRKSVV